MGESAKKILFVCSEMLPYLPDSPVASIGRYLPQGVQERGREIRSFMPRYGCINERKNQLHEVIRLSGMNIIIDDVDRPLVIKVASIAAARMQVYFIDNEDYFKRRNIWADDEGNPFRDNGQRAIFFARGVLETVKKLRWAPDIIHCHGWISHILPLYLKKVYVGDPIFSSSKVVLSLYDDASAVPMTPGLREIATFGGIKPDDAIELETPDGINLAKLAARYSDGVILASDKVEEEVITYCKDRSLPVLPYDGAAMENGAWIDQYNAFYDNI